MARIRTIKPEFYTNEKLSALGAETHLFAGGLLCYADDEGYFNANPGLVKGAIFPVRECSLSIQGMLTELSNVGYIELGTGADGRRFGRVVEFVTHQRVNRPTPSKIKTLPIVWESSVTTHGGLTEDSRQERNREQGTGKGKEEPRAGARSDSDPDPGSEEASQDEAGGGGEFLGAGPCREDVEEGAARARARAAKAGAIEIPDWIPRDRWEAFVRMRKKIRHPLTDEAIELAIRELEKFRADGEDVGKVLDQSVLNSWRGLFSTRGRGGGGGKGDRGGGSGGYAAEGRGALEGWMKDQLEEGATR